MSTAQLTVGPHRIDINPQKNLLDNCLSAGFDAVKACRNAACGICRAKVINGTVHYKDTITPRGLNSDELAQGYCLPCATHSSSDLELEWPDLRKTETKSVQKLSCQVQSVTPISADTHLVILTSDSPALSQFSAGQYMQLIMPDGSPRAFSIASAPEAQHLELHVRAIDGHVGAKEVVGHFQRRSVVTIELPFGECLLPDNDHPLLMIAGGTGFAPMKAMIESSFARHESRELWLYWGGADKQALYWHNELIALSKGNSRFHYVPVILQSDAQWYGATGFPHVVAAKDHEDLSHFEVFCSGSEGMARAVYAFMQAHGVADHRFHSDWINILRAQSQL